MARDVTTHLMFEGTAEEAMSFYVSLFSDSKVEQIKKYGAGEMKFEGSVKLAEFSLAGRKFLCIDSPVKRPLHLHPGDLHFRRVRVRGRA